MKKFLAILMIALILLCIIGTGIWGIMCVNDYQRIANDPSSSGIDYLVIYVYMLGFAGLGVFGFTFALVLPMLTSKSKLRLGAYICAALFALEFFAAVALAFM